MTESDGEATRGSSSLLGGAFFLFVSSCAAHMTLANQLAVERRVSRAAQRKNQPETGVAWRSAGLILLAFFNLFILLLKVLILKT
jgi:hypothetical protein